MAEKIHYTPKKYDPKDELLLKLAEAPSSHVEAVLDAFEILQLLRDKGILEMVKGGLGSGEKVLNVLTETLEMDQVVALVRNLTIMTKILGGMNPEFLEGVQKTLVKEVAAARSGHPPGLFDVVELLFSKNSRRFLGMAAKIADAMGENLAKAEVPANAGEKRQVVKRHRVIPKHQVPASPLIGNPNS